MNIDKSSLQKLAEMDDAELKKSILSVAAACGADIKKLERHLGDIPSLKKSISSLSQKDIDRAMKRMGEKRADIISQSIKNMK